MSRLRKRSVSNRRKKIINRWLRFLKEDGDWDYGFMLKMERMKLEQMEDYFKKLDTFAGIEFVQRDLRLALRLMDIIQEKDDLKIEVSPMKIVSFREDDRKLYRLDGDGKVLSYRKIYVNMRNASRFVCHSPEKFAKTERTRLIYQNCLRQTKAWFLYNKLRAYRMFIWWA